MTFLEARYFQLQFGPFAGKRLGDIGHTETGLCYLNLLSELDKACLWEDTREAIECYLSQPGIKRKLEVALEKERTRRSAHA